MRYYKKGNDLRYSHLQAQNRAFDAKRHGDLVDRVIAAYDSRYFDAVRDWGLTRCPGASDFDKVHAKQEGRC